MITCIDMRKKRGAWEREKDRGGREKNVFMGRAWAIFLLRAGIILRGPY